MKLILLALLTPLLSLGLLKAQELSNVSTKVDGEFITIFYTVTDNEEMEGRSYIVELFAIINQRDTLKLEELEGDVGIVYAGEHYIQWNVRKEFERFRGTIVFEVRVTPVFVITRPVTETAPLIRGRGNFIKWYGGGSHNDLLTLELYKNQELVAVIDTVQDDNKYLWRVPPNTKVGKGFQIRIVGTGKTGIDQYSDYFVIRRKIPLWAQIAPILAAVGVGTYFILNPPEPGIEKLPPPLNPDHN